jgi:hypothetical protein
VAILTGLAVYWLNGDTKIVIINTNRLSQNTCELPLLYYLSIYEILGCYYSDYVVVAAISRKFEGSSFFCTFWISWNVWPLKVEATSWAT